MTYDQTGLLVQCRNAGVVPKMLHVPGHVLARADLRHHRFTDGAVGHKGVDTLDQLAELETAHRHENQRVLPSYRAAVKAGGLRPLDIDMVRQVQG